MLGVFHLTVLVASFACSVLGDAVELPPLPSDRTTPYQQRLAYSGPSGMYVAWNTYQQISKPTVKYGTSASALTSSASSTKSVTYQSSRTWTNSVLISGLKPATTYYYQIVSTNSSIDTFTTGRPAGDLTPFSIAAVVDLGLVGQYGYTADSSGNSSGTPKRALSDISSDIREDGSGERSPSGAPKRAGLGVQVPVPPDVQHTTIGTLANMAGQYDFVLHPGDISYADDWLLGWATGVDPGSLLEAGQIYEGLMELFYNQLSVVSRFRPYMVGPGNHEADCDEVTLSQFLCPSGQQNFTAYRNHFGGILPAIPASHTTIKSSRSLSYLSPIERDRHVARATAASLSNPPFWYSFEYGMTHFVVFNTETDIESGVAGPEEKGGSEGLNNGPFGSANQQIEFLKADLAGVDRKLTPWVVVAGHRPWYTTGTPCTICQTAFEPIFNQYNVDLAIFGHVHNMQRLVPIANNVVDPAGLNNPKAPWYIVTGAAGNIEGRSSIGSNPPKYLAWGNDDDYGFSFVNFLNRTHLEVQFVNADDGGILDSAVLYKAHQF